jgi:hypothetical protein
LGVFLVRFREHLNWADLDRTGRGKKVWVKHKIGESWSEKNKQTNKWAPGNEISTLNLRVM